MYYYFSGKICQKESNFMMLFVVAKNILVVLFQIHTAFLFKSQLLLLSQFGPKQMYTNNTCHSQQLD